MNAEWGELTLRLERYVAQYGMSRQALTVSVDQDALLDMVAVRLVRKVAVIDGQKTIVVPVSWVDALKDAERDRSPIMRWIIRRWPPRHHVYQAFEALPNFPVQKFRGSEARLAFWREVAP